MFFPIDKEPSYFGRDLGNPSPTLDEYLACFAAARHHKRIGEASTIYLRSKSAPGEIKEFCADARIIIMLRNPIEIMEALHSQRRFLGTEPIADFAAAVEADEQGPRPEGWAPYQSVARCAPQVRRYLEIFGRRRTHLIIFDDFKRDTAAAFRDTLRFLEVSEDFRPDFRIVNQNKTVRSKWLQRLVERPPALASRLVRTLPRPIYRRVLKTMQALYTRTAPRPEMDPRLRNRLAVALAPDVAALGELVGRDLTHWIPAP